MKNIILDELIDEWNARWMETKSAPLDAEDKYQQGLHAGLEEGYTACMNDLMNLLSTYRDREKR